jgi:4a-hydroxytetrahydrobiopterin dehydratase
VATLDEIEQLHAGVSGWEIVEIDGVNRLRRTFEFSSYRETIDFVNKVADLAEEQGHHPDMLVEYGRATVSWWTHKIGGLHENDFIMAAKTDRLAG